MLKIFSVPTILGAALVAGALPACGGAVGEAVRPTDHTAAGAVTAGNGAATCSGNAKYAKPLIVDLDADARVDLEAAMKKGLVIVSYDCSNLRVLSSCKLPDATYEYAGTSRKEQVVQIKNADDLSVNLPLSSAKLSGELTSGRTIDLALVLVGRRSTTVAKVDRDDLQGGCDGATHYLQNATLGAFSMQTGSVGKVAAVAEMFGRGGAAASNSERKAMTSDGSLDDCRTSNPDAESPPTECRAPIRVELLPIGGDEPHAKSSGKPKDGKEDKEKEKEAVAAINPCPPGYAFVDGLCTKAAEQAHLCAATDEAECKEQCEKGSAESCLNYGILLQKKPGGMNGAAALPFFKKACDGDIAEGCKSQGWVIVPGDMEEPGAGAKAKEALGLFQKACTMGNADGCSWYGDMLTEPDYKLVDMAKAVRVYDRGCSLGSGDACFSLSQLYFKGNGVTKDAVHGAALLNKACQAGDAVQCVELGDVLAKGKFGLSVDTALAMRVYDRACNLDYVWCDSGAKLANKNGDFEQAFSFAKRGCDLSDTPDTELCELLGNLHSEGKGTTKDAAKANTAWIKACDKGEGEESACKRLGIKMKD